MPKEFWQDPLSLRTGQVGRDGCRVPIPWSGTEAPFGFGPGPGSGPGQPWIPQPPEWGRYSAELQTGDPESTLEFYRRALLARREHAVPGGDRISDLEVDGDVLRFRRGDLLVVLNCGTAPVALPAGRVILSSGPVEDGQLPPNTSCWLSNASL